MTPRNALAMPWRTPSTDAIQHTRSCAGAALRSPRARQSWEPIALARVYHGMHVTHVVARIGDSVVANEYVRPRGTMRGARAFAITSIAALIGAAALFAMGLRDAATDEHAYHLLVRVHHAPAWAFRPTTAPHSLDALFVATIALAIGAGIAAVWAYRRATRFITAPLPTGALVTHETTDVPAPRELRFRHPPFEKRAAMYFVVSLAAHLAFALVLPGLDDSPVATIAIQEFSGSTPFIGDDNDDARGGDSSPSTVAATSLRLPTSDGGHAGHTPTVTDVRGRRAGDLAGDHASGSALLASTSFVQLAGAADLAAGFSDGASLTPWSRREEFGSERSLYGEISGSETMTIESGAYQTASKCPPIRTHVARAPTLHCTFGMMAAPLINGLDSAIIRRVIKQNVEAISYCYDKALLSDHTLAGTVTAEFLISANGHVQGSTASGMPVIDECVADAVARIQFPSATHGGLSQVTYPFRFYTTE